MAEDELTGAAELDLSAWRPARVRMSLPSAPESLAVARRAVGAFLATETQDELASNLKLVVSELVANAVAHRANGDEIQLVLTRYVRHAHVSVHNGGPATDLKRFRVGSPDGGRGLDIVAALSEGWSIETRPTGTTVTARVPAPRLPSMDSKRALELASVLNNAAARQRSVAIGQCARASVMRAANVERRARLTVMLEMTAARAGNRRRLSP